MEHKPKKGDTLRAIQWTHQKENDFKELARLSEDYGEGQTLTLYKGTWRIRYKDYDKFFVATDENPVTFRRINDK